jgi:predicted metal-dependent phosphoesterase TrpH
VPLIDLHTHTHPGSYDSDLSPDELIDAAKQAGLDAVCLTEHDFFWERDDALALGRRHAFLVIPGVEVNTEHGHVLTFGVERFVYGMHRLSELTRLVRQAGGAMIGAHPYRRQLPFELEREGDWSEALDRACRNEKYALVDAVETLNGRGTGRQNAFSLEVCARTRLPQTAGSDAHEPADIGAVATEFEDRIEGLADLIAALKAGRFRPIRLG